ncbi:DUF2842 domain-containing protein [Phreatobacter oligotrophus]|jgi:hypothetical protein|uniref:Uncharacterized protein DUF2842 n=1 Tax=Phreatobacter oligotrophus TaxID=1122261 RepID=A0A2T4Z6A7_9HYPH|nr:DUF2842 domain-containing protein [Phreatobacter oligotrophus]MBX9992621.1 DUF2842 domain-containing protein [Phreatobacter oligotrophus]PTM57405.1 uncharacterized protein DUF2842 [Phreatobacter oligotrophus]
MRQRTRKLFGTILLLVWVTFYALIVMAIMHNAVRRFGPIGEPLFYAAAGIAWIPVAMLVIWWMGRPDPEEDEA